MNPKPYFRIPPCLALLIAASLTAPAQAARPATVEDAYTVEPGKLELETAFDFVKDGRAYNYSTPFALTYGVTDRLEVGMDFGLQTEERRVRDESRERSEGLLDTVVFAKWQFLDQDGPRPNLSVAPSWKVPTASSSKGLGTGEWDPGVLLIATWDEGDFSVDANIGYAFLNRFRGSLIQGEAFIGVAGRYRADHRIEFVSEVFAASPEFRTSDTIGGFSVGAAWAVSDRMILDAAAGTGIGRDSPDVTATLGITWVWW